MSKKMSGGARLVVIVLVAVFAAAIGQHSQLAAANRRMVSVVLLAGGKGSRFSSSLQRANQEAQFEVPRHLRPVMCLANKVLAPLGSVPLAAVKMQRLAEGGLTRFHVISDHGSYDVERAIATSKGPTWNVSLHRRQADDTLLRVVYRVLKENGSHRGDVVIASGDTLSTINYGELLKHHRGQSSFIRSVDSQGRHDSAGNGRMATALNAGASFAGDIFVSPSVWSLKPDNAHLPVLVERLAESANKEPSTDSASSLRDYLGAIVASQGSVVTHDAWNINTVQDYLKLAKAYQEMDADNPIKASVMAVKTRRGY